MNACGLGIWEAELLEDNATLRATDLANAWAYAEAYLDEIETAIQENEEEGASEAPIKCSRFGECF